MLRAQLDGPDTCHARASVERQLVVAIVAMGLTLLLGQVAGQTIDFETLPSGEPTEDTQPISDDYEPFGVSFVVVDPEGNAIHFPRIAKVGPPRTAFQGCRNGDDDPAPDQAIGESFLTDDDQVGWSGNVRVLLEKPVSEATGVLLDVDRPNPGKFEQWTITAFDRSGRAVDEFVLTAPKGPDTECATVEGVGPGEGAALPWYLRTEDPEIASIVFAYTGTHSFVGFALDNLSLSMLPRSFIRGDCNDDGTVAISDAVCILNWLFLGGAAPRCIAVTNTNGDVDPGISDATYLLNHLFIGGPAPVPPYPDCGSGTLPMDEEMGCETPPKNCAQ